MTTHRAKTLFNDGEGLEIEDLNGLQSLLENQRLTLSGASAATLGNGLDLGNQDGTAGADPYSEFSVQSLLFPDSDENDNFQNVIFLPFPFTGVGRVDESNGEFDFHGGMIFAQRGNASTPGTHPSLPSAYADPDFSMMMSKDGGVTSVSLNGGSFPSTNPRIDSLNVRLGFSDGDSQSRDFEDATTRAKSTSSVEKERQQQIEFERVEGSEAASPSAPSPSSGYGRFATVELHVGDSFPLSHDRFQLHAFPARLRSEIVFGADGWNSDSNGWDRHNAAGNIYAARHDGTAGSTPIYFSPRQMHEGCRLVGIGIDINADGQDHRIDIGYIDYTGAFTVLQNLDASAGGGPIQTSGGPGYYLVGLSDFDQPIWGNGKAYGPLFTHRRDSNGLPEIPVDALTSWDKLCLRIDRESGSDFDSGDTISAVQFFYLE